VGVRPIPCASPSWTTAQFGQTRPVYERWQDAHNYLRILWVTNLSPNVHFEPSLINVNNLAEYFNRYIHFRRWPSGMSTVLLMSICCICLHASSCICLGLKHISLSICQGTVEWRGPVTRQWVVRFLKARAWPQRAHRIILRISFLQPFSQSLAVCLGLCRWCDLPVRPLDRTSCAVFRSLPRNASSWIWSQDAEARTGRWNLNSIIAVSTTAPSIIRYVTEGAAR
jgi:hypothetical protein